MTATLQPEAVDVDKVLDGPQTREAAIEHVDKKKGTILVRAVPYDHEIELYEGVFEEFGQGAFARAADAPHRVKMRNEHGGPIVGVGTSIEDRPDGSWTQFRFANTLAGQEARELTFDEIIDQVSVTFRVMKDWMKVTRSAKGLHVRHARAHLLDVSLVGHGAYGDAAFVAAVRSAATERDQEIAGAAVQLEQQKRERLAALARLSH